MERLTDKIEDRYIERQERLSNGKIVGTKMCLRKLGEIEDLEERLQKYTTIDAISALKGLLSQYEAIEKMDNKRKAFEEESGGNNWIQELEEANRNYIPKTLSDFSIGDVVRVNTTNPNNMRVHGLPAYLINGTLIVVGFTKKKVKCDWDGGKPFHIDPDLLRKVE